MTGYLPPSPDNSPSDFPCGDRLLHTRHRCDEYLRGLYLQLMIIILEYQDTRGV